MQGNSLEDLRDFFRRKPTTRLTSLFEWDKRFNTKCFQEEIHPKYLALVKKHLADEGKALTEFFGEEDAEDTLAKIETFFALCSPTDTPFENLQLGVEFLILFLAMKEFMARNRTDSALVNKLVATTVRILQGEKEVAAESSKFQTLVEYTSRFHHQLVRRVELESSAGSQGQLAFFNRSFEAALKASAQEALNNGSEPEDLTTYCAHRQHSIGAEPWINLWATLGFPSDPFLNTHNTDPHVSQLLQLTKEIIFLTNDVGSVIKDKKKGNQNVVLSVLHKLPNTPEKEAVDVVVSMIEHKADEFFGVSDKIPLVEADFLWYFELLKKVMRGNWQCQTKLKDSFNHEVADGEKMLI